MLRHNHGVSAEPPHGVRRVALLMSSAREDFVARLYAETLEMIGVLNHDERLRGLLEASIAENIMAAINFLERGGDAVEEVSAPSAALTYARTLAQRDVPLSALIRAYRIGHAQFLDEAIPLIATLDDVDHLLTSAALVKSSGAFIDRVCDQVGDAYEVERDRWVSSRSGLRQQWLADVLRGQGVDTKQAERHLGYTFDGLHVAVTLWPAAEVSGPEVPRVLGEASQAIRAGLKAIGRALVVPNDEREVNAWFRLPRPDGDVRSMVESALQTLGTPVFAALGQPASGLDGFRRTLDEASRTARIRLASGHDDPRVTSFEQVELVALAAGDMDAARRFVRRVLGSLAGGDDRATMLRGTLREFLARRGSYSATAEVLTMHRNTVQYRVQQAVDLSAADLSDPDHASDVVSALELCWWMGRAVTV